VLKALKRVENAFKQKTDVVHFIFGFIAGIFNVFGIVGFSASVIMIVSFIIYQTGEDEPKAESYFNMLEFALGFILSLPFVMVILFE
jgi:cytochrome c biogenesis protein CcdA